MLYSFFYPICRDARACNEAGQSPDRVDSVPFPHHLPHPDVAFLLGKISVHQEIVDGHDGHLGPGKHQGRGESRRQEKILLFTVVQVPT